MIVCGVFDPRSQCYFTVSFIYASNCLIERRLLWQEISALSSNSLISSKPWLLLGDFNQILSQEEHFSVPTSLPSLTGMDELSTCLTTNNLKDLTARGNFFTWTNYQPSTPTLRKLDRVVTNDHWSISFPNSLAIFDPPGSSDHSVCIIQMDMPPPTLNKPFKFFIHTTLHPQNEQIVSAAWEIPGLYGTDQFYLASKLTATKKSLKTLNRAAFSDIRARARESLTSLLDIQSALLSNPTDALFSQEIQARTDYAFYSHAEELFLKQKSRIKWLTVGDSNSPFFYRCLLSHQAANRILFLRDSADLEIYDPVAIKQHTVSYFQSLLGTENTHTRPASIDMIRSIQPFQCSPSDSALLSRIPSPEEIKVAIFTMPKDKAPGPDGFPIDFFTKTWNTVGAYSIRAVSEFFISGRRLKRFNSTAITLIPKVANADRIQNFRPISCCNSVYKIITRILSNRLRLLLPTIIFPNQAGFLKGRLLTENVLLASEILNDSQK